jgi:hypothetical protein
VITVRIHPRFVIPYYSLYLEGLVRVYGAGALSFGREGLPDETQYNDGFAFTVQSADSSTKRTRRIYISANDFSRYDQVALAWCDRYGMVNGSLEEECPPKVLPIGPSFGIGQWGSLARTYRDIATVFAHMRYPARELFRRLRQMRKYFFERVPEAALVPGVSDANYVFFVAWPWQKHPEVNPPRARFMRACRTTPGVVFEGGFAPRRRGAMPDLDDITANRLYPFREWLARTRRSGVAFNNAAVHGCLGWKLGEFLALGKAVLSLPLTRRVPGQLLHGEQLHFVNDTDDSIAEGVARVLSDHAYRARLERGARAYYTEYLAPERVIRRLVSDAEPR